VLRVPLEVQGLIIQELPTRVKGHKERSEEIKRMSKKFKRKEVF